jgi:hypothetical protein
VSTSSRTPGTSARNISIAASEFTHDPAQGSSNAPGAARHHRTARSQAPAPAAGAGVAHHVGWGFGNAVGQPTGSARVAGSVPNITSMCANPSSLAWRDAATGSPKP